MLTALAASGHLAYYVPFVVSFSPLLGRPKQFFSRGPNPLFAALTAAAVFLHLTDVVRNELHREHRPDCLNVIGDMC